MKIRLIRAKGRRCAALSTEMTMALAILASTVIPLSFSFMLEARIVKDAYQDAVAMEIVDGEMEILAAGAWTAASIGEHPYPVTAESARNLPPGQFLLTRARDRIQLEWRPERVGKGHIQRREVLLP